MAWSQDEYEAFQMFENSLIQKQPVAVSRIPIHETAVKPSTLSKSKLKVTAPSFVPSFTSKSFVPAIVPSVSSSGGRASYVAVNAQLPLDADNLNFLAEDCPDYFGNGCLKV